MFKPLKSYFNKACKDFLSCNPGRLIRSEDLAFLLSQSWSKAVTPVNIMSGFMKAGIYPLNPGQIIDRQICPSKLFSTPDDSDGCTTPGTSGSDVTSVLLI